MSRFQPRLADRHLRQRAHGCVQVTPHVDPQRTVRIQYRCHGPVRGGQCLPGRLKETLPGLGEPDPLAATVEQVSAERGLQAGDAFGQRLLGDRQVFGRMAEVQFCGGQHERAHLRQVEIHPCHLR